MTITAETSMRTAARYADEAIHFRDAGSRILMRAKWLCLCMCEAATVSALHGPDEAYRKINMLVGGEHERDVWRTRGAV